MGHCHKKQSLQALVMHLAQRKHRVQPRWVMGALDAQGFLGDAMQWFDQSIGLLLSCYLCVLEDNCQRHMTLDEHHLCHPQVVHLDIMGL